MKTKIFIAASCLMLSVFAFGQNVQPVKADNVALEVKKSVQSGFYEITINQAHPTGGQVLYLNSDYSIRISGDSIFVHLPYFGRIYSAPINYEDGGIKFANSMNGYKVNYKKGKSHSINFTAKVPDDTYRFSITLWTNGKATVNVSCSKRQGISYMGNLNLSQSTFLMSPV